MRVLEAQGESDIAVRTGRQCHADMAEELTICVLVIGEAIERLVADHLGMSGAVGAQPPPEPT